MTVPVIVEIIFRFIPSALLVFGFIEINLTAKYNKYIQFIAINTVYLFAGLTVYFFIPMRSDTVFS